jgi:hypothetical protein
VSPLTLAAVWLLSFACPTANAQSRGEDYAPKDGRFTIRFPGKPKSTTQTARSEIGDLEVSTATYATSDGNVFLVSYTDFPEEATKSEAQKTLFDGVREGLKGKDGKVLSEKEVKVGEDKLPGRDLEIEKGKQRIRFRAVLRDNRLYQIAVVGSASFVAGKDAGRFFESFELTN